jgi:hypothetical protein
VARGRPKPITWNALDRQVRQRCRDAGLDGCVSVHPWLPLEEREAATRDHAYVYPDRLDFWFSAKVLALPAEHRDAIVDHEVGHCLAQKHWGSSTEDEADAAAEQWLGTEICYDRAWPGKGLQVTCAGTRTTNPKRIPMARAGVQTATSLTPEYGEYLAAVATGRARYVGEHIDAQGVKTIAVDFGKGKRRNPAIGISREFFTTVLKDYADWREKWWREAIQNSVDARATRIDCEAVQMDNGNWSIAVEDDGGGMTEDVLLNKFLMLGGSTKVLGSGASGGFGKAKELLILPWLSWTVHSRDRIVVGQGLDYEVNQAAYKDGTRLKVVMPGDQTTNAAAAIAFITKCNLPHVRFSVLEHVEGNEAVRHRPRADLAIEDVLETLPDKLMIGVSKVDYEAAHLYVRVNGLYMFSSWMSRLEGKQVIAEILAPSTEILTANRDGFRDWATRSQVDKLTERFSKDVLSALRSKSGLIRKKYEGKGKFQAERAQSEVLAQISYVPPVDDDGFTTMNARDIDSISQVMNYVSQRVIRQESTDEREGLGVAIPDGALAAELLRSVDFEGAHHVEESVRQLAWAPDFYVINEIEGFKVPTKFLPESMKPQVVKLARTWTELCRYVLMQLGNFRPFGVGFMFSENAAAAYLEEEGERWLMLNPFTSVRGRKDTWTPSKQDHLKKLYAFAIHECTHLADGVEYHDEAFSTALTMNIAKTADGFRKIRKIVGAIRMRDIAIADIARNPRGGRLGQRIRLAGT